MSSTEQSSGVTPWRAISRRTFLRSAAAITGGACLAPFADAAPRRKPNVVFILADDLGWRDSSLYGSTFFKTPHIDALAKRGMMFTQAYAANPLCSATRASLVTGLWPARLGLTGASGHIAQVILEKRLVKAAPPNVKALSAISTSRVDTKCYTVAEAFKDAGYTTGHFGKWHLGREPYDPLHQGFDVDIPHTSAPSPLPKGYLAPWPVWPGQGAPGEHLEDRMAEEAVKFIRDNRDRPFLLHYWAFSVHSPWQAKQHLIEKYAKRVDPDNPQHNPVYAAMVESFDDAVGRLVGALDEEGLTENTVIIFLSDNGGWSWGAEQFIPDPYKGVPITSNSPLRGGKATIYEGGTREPFVVVWPGVVQPGTRNDQAIVSSVDYFPTMVDMLGLPTEPDQEFDGVSIRRALEGKTLKRDTIFCHFPHSIPATGAIPATYVRKGDWKLIRNYCDGENGTDTFELYNLKDDIGETRNLAAEKPRRVKRLRKLLEDFLEETGAVVPIPNPRYKSGDA